MIAWHRDSWQQMLGLSVNVVSAFSVDKTNGNSITAPCSESVSLK